MNAKDLKQSALVKKELAFLQNYNRVIYKLDESMEFLAKELGETKIVLHKVYKTLYEREAYDDISFLIDKKTYKTLKSYYKKKGFKVRKTMNKIIISW